MTIFDKRWLSKAAPALLAVSMAAGLLAGCGRPAPPAAAPAEAPTAAVQAPAPAGEAETESAWWNDTVFYEVFVRSFQDSDGDGSGDLQGLIDRSWTISTTATRPPPTTWASPASGSCPWRSRPAITATTPPITPRSRKTTATTRISSADRGGAPPRHQGDRRPGAEPHLDRAPLVRRLGQRPGRREARLVPLEPTDDGSKAPWSGGGPVWHKQGDDYYFAMFWEGMPDLNYEQPRGHGRDGEGGPLLAGGDGGRWLPAGRGAPPGGGRYALFRRAGHPSVAGRLRRLSGHGRSQRADRGRGLGHHSSGRPLCSGGRGGPGFRVRPG
jgi:hypothetical protein